MKSNRRPLWAVLCLVSTPAFSAAPAVAAAPACPKVASTTVASKGDIRFRQSAQKGLFWLAGASQKWTQEHSCFGCHVQAVTMEALATGKHNQYDVNPSDIANAAKALSMGVTAGGHVTGVAFEGSAWARYDQWVDAKETEKLLQYAAELVTLQSKQNGAVNDDDRRLPVTGGTMQTTYQAMQTWRQAYARTGDQKWLPPMRKAEGYLAGIAESFKDGEQPYIQDVNFALMGLVAAGVGSTEKPSLKLQHHLLGRQNQDGGWGLDAKKSDAFATGQTLYSLKLAGFSESDPAIQKGMKYLVEQQTKDGMWKTYASNQGGAEKGETMWAVLGLVSVDVMSVAVTGVFDGQHVEPKMPLSVEAKDNNSGGIAQLQLLVDDLPVKTECGAAMKLTWETASLKEGKHVLDVVATNLAGKTSKRRFEVYAGNVFLTQVGARFDDQQQKSEISFRNIAPDAVKGAVVVQVLQPGADGDTSKGTEVFTTSPKSAQGANTFEWDGKGSDGKPLPRGRYLARLTFKDDKGKPVQSETVVFFHDSEDVQKAKFGEVQGQLGLRGGQDQSANTLVELVDEKGRVVQQTRTTEQGNYSFQNVDKGNYKVRARKEGFKDLEAPVSAAPMAAPAKASMSW